MPRGDGTGPQGEGPRTGIGRGRCNPKDRVSAPKGRNGKRSGRRAGKGQRQRAGLDKQSQIFVRGRLQFFLRKGRLHSVIIQD
jgi:hypothetical protein